LRLKRVLFIFRRDLRIQDNTALHAALKAAEEVVPCFIFTPDQIEHNPYRSDRSLQFMLESLEDLSEEFKKKNRKLYFFYGNPHKVLEECIHKLEIEGVFLNNDYTPYSIGRDKLLEDVCKKYGIAFVPFEDLLLHPIEETLKENGMPYTIFTPFFRHGSKLKVRPPLNSSHTSFYSKPITFCENNAILKKILPERQKQKKGGRKECLKILKDLSSFKNYTKTHDIPALDATTHLSAHLKFTTCSIREVYYAIVKELGGHSDLIHALFWRDFFTQIGFHFPHVFEGAFKTKFNKMEWSDSRSSFKRWCEGNTGFPIVDAGMRELNQTGFMHNRLRLITASFLVKDLHLNWQWGEKYYAQHLIDYDPAVNNGNWQWVASTGCDAQPFFRIFNPWTQQKKFDPQCLYIKKWIPELNALSPQMIHDWENQHVNYTAYPPPMVDHSKEAKLALAAYQKI
jgi:deoxyribodipyrimidine photo-lyase